MPNLAAILKGEILRLAQKSIKQAVASVKADQKRMRRDIAALRQEITAVKKTAKALPAVKNVAAAKDKGAEEEVRGGIRPTGKSVRALREKFGMSQDELARLVGVGRVTVARWESADSKIQFRGAETRASFAAIMKLGKKEAWARIGGGKSAEPKGETGAKAAEKKSEKQPAKRGRKPRAAAVVATVKPAAKRGRKPKAQVTVVALPGAEAVAPGAAHKNTQRKPGKVVRKARRKK